MKYKKIMFMLVLAVFLLSITCVSASEIDDTLASEDTNTIGLSVDKDIIEDNLQTSEENDELASTDYDEAIAQTDTEVLGADSATYFDLAEEIGQPGNINLIHKNYTYDGGEPITILEDNKVIDGNGAVIDMNGSTIRAFYISGSGVTIKNLTIKNVNSDGGGGAIYFYSTGTVTNCNFTDNIASIGGAISMYSGTVTNCNFTGNTATVNGGAVFFYSTGNVTNCNFTGNTATVNGSAVFFYSTGNVTNCNFTNNTANRDGGAVYFNSNGEVTNCNFTGNTANRDGGAVYFNSNGEVTNCNFTNNKATGTGTYDGGGAVHLQGTGTVTNCNFTNNTANREGGAVYFFNQGTVSNCNFTGNTANRYGGAVYFQSTSTVSNCNFTGNTATGDGGAVFFNGKGDVANCNFTNNKATGDGGAVFFNGKGDVTNCNFTNNKATGTDSRGGAITMSFGTVTNCNFTNNTATSNGGAIISGTGTVANCNFVNNSATGEGSWGGAIRMYSGTVTNCNFTGNTAGEGGAVYFFNTGSVSNCNFTDNSAYRGGAVYFNETGTVSNCNFTDNSAYRGGAVYFQSTGNVSNCNFTNNTATGDGGAVYFNETGTVPNCNFTDNSATVNGGAVYFNGNGEVTNCNFTNNTATGDGGAVYFFDQGTVTNCNFINNTASSHGGAIWISSGRVENCNFTDNRATGDGGAIRFSSSSSTVSNCNFTHNSANRGSAVYFDNSGRIENCNLFNNSATRTGGAIYFRGSNAFVTNCNLVDNRAIGSDGGGAIWMNSGKIVNCNFTNNNAFGNGGAVVLFAGDVENCNFINNQAINGNGGAIWMSTGSVTNSNFVNHNASYNGGAIWMGSGKIDNCNFTGNNATAGSAIFIYSTSDSKNVSNSCFLNNRANAENLDVTINENNIITITFTGNDNLLNAIYSNGDVDFSNVTYWGANRIANTDDSPVVRSKNEAGQNITVVGVVNGNIMNITKVTDSDGKIVLEDIVGDYCIIVRHNTDSYYTEAEKISTNMKLYANVTPQTTNNRTVNITAKSNIPNEVINGKLLFILPNGTQINATYGANGTWWAVHEFDKYDVYQVNATYVGLDNVTINNGTITINKVNSTITLENIVLDYGDSKNVTVTTEGATGITAKIDGNNVTVINNYTIQIPVLDAGTYNLTVTTIPDDDYNPVTKEANITVNKLSTEIILANETLDLKVGDEVPVLVNLTPAGAGNLTFTSSDEDIVFVEDNVTIVANSQGQAIITVSFAGNENYTAAENKTITVNVALNDASVSVENDTLNLKVDETYAINATIKPDTILLKIKYTSSNESVATVDKNGIVTAVGEGRAIITLEVGDNEIYAKNSTTVTVNVKDNTINVSALDVTKYYNGTESFVVIVTDSKNNPLANQSVIINVVGVNYTRTTDANGTASIAISLISGQYNVTTIVNNNTVYSKITVLPTVNATDLVKVFRNATQFYATFKDSQGNYLADGTMVRFNINGVMYDRKISGNNGLAKLNINLEQGQYIITSMNLETGENAANNVTVISRLIENKELVKYYRNATQYTVKVIGDDGNPVGAGESVTFNINGVIYTRQTNGSGIAKLNINLHPGDYIITAEYKDCRVSNNIKVLPVLTADDLTKKYGTPDQFIATLVDGQGNPFAGETVQFNVNGIFYNRVTDSNGQSKLNIRLMPGKYVITSSYNGTNIANTITISA